MYGSEIRVQGMNGGGFYDAVFFYGSFSSRKLEHIIYMGIESASYFIWFFLFFFCAAVFLLKVSVFFLDKYLLFFYSEMSTAGDVIYVYVNRELY